MKFDSAKKSVMQVYFDNAATTPLDPRVREAMIEVMDSGFGNPSSIHGPGRKARTLIEQARKTIAQILGAAPAEIFFTSGGTEADNTAIVKSVQDLGIRHVVSSPTEHHAVLHTLEALEKNNQIQVTWLHVNHKGEIDLEELNTILGNNPRSLVSLMHGNNEIGTLIDIEKTSEICKAHQSVFHSDTVQTIGHFSHNLHALQAQFITGSAHKFHGPKGVGFLYINQNTKISPFIHGGAQERNMRGGTENIMGIVGLAKALEIADQERNVTEKHIKLLKSYLVQSLEERIPDVQFQGETDPDKSLYTILNVSFPFKELADMLLFSFDIAGISVSGGSACSSGTNIGSHVLDAIGADPNRPCVRFSFSKYNTFEEIDWVVNKIVEIGR